MSNFFADVSSKIIALADPVLSQPDMKREMVSPPAGAQIPSEPFLSMRIFRNLRKKMSIFMPRHGLASSVAKVKRADNRANGADTRAKTNSQFAKVISAGALSSPISALFY